MKNKCFFNSFIIAAIGIVAGCSSNSDTSSAASGRSADPVEEAAIRFFNDYFLKGEVDTIIDAMPAEKMMEDVGPLGGPESARNGAQSDKFTLEKKCGALKVESRGKEQVSGNVWIVKLAVIGECDFLKARAACAADVQRGGLFKSWLGKANEFGVGIAQTSDGTYYTSISDMRSVAGQLGAAMRSKFECPSQASAPTENVDGGAGEQASPPSGGEEDQASSEDEVSFEEMMAQCAKQASLEAQETGSEVPDDIETQCRERLSN